MFAAKLADNEHVKAIILCTTVNLMNSIAILTLFNSILLAAAENKVL